jgi:UDP-N-acetylglucosamine transferase subunit ALG13
MIFISVGNNQQGFLRLFKKFEIIYNKELNKKLKVICQIGYTNYTNKNFEIVRFMEKKIFNKLVRDSSLFISHAGAGSVIDSINNNKIPILLPRETKYNEHVDNHQVEFYKKLLAIQLASPFAQIYKYKNKKINNKVSKKKLIFK